jgi:hypothetical protein|nr:MAG TPA: hypothetical protein [Inoviridae sp.]
MARNKDSKFGAADGFDFSNQYENNTQEVQQVSTRSTTSDIIKEENKIGSTQGRKGHKLKRINMAFSDANHEFITIESRKLGISATEFTNKIIEAYRKNL